MAASSTWSLFTTLLTQGLVLLCVDAYCIILWDLPGDVLAAPESALCGWIGGIPLSLSLPPWGGILGSCSHFCVLHSACQSPSGSAGDCPGSTCIGPVWLERCHINLSLSLSVAVESIAKATWTYTNLGQTITTFSLGTQIQKQWIAMQCSLHNFGFTIWYVLYMRHEMYLGHALTQASRALTKMFI